MKELEDISAASKIETEIFQHRIDVERREKERLVREVQSLSQQLQSVRKV